jgi:hypothetical protein
MFFLQAIYSFRFVFAVYVLSVRLHKRRSIMTLAVRYAESCAAGRMTCVVILCAVWLSMR